MTTSRKKAAAAIFVVLIITFGAIAVFAVNNNSGISGYQDESLSVSMNVYEINSLHERNINAISFNEAAEAVALYIRDVLDGCVDGFAAHVTYSNEARIRGLIETDEFWIVEIAVSRQAIRNREILYLGTVEAVTGDVISVLPAGQHGMFPGGYHLRNRDGFDAEDIENSETVFKLVYCDDTFAVELTAVADMQGQAHPGRLNLLCSNTGKVVPVIVHGIDTGFPRLIFSTEIPDTGRPAADFSTGERSPVFVGLH